MLIYSSFHHDITPSFGWLLFLSKAEPLRKKKGLGGDVFGLLLYCHGRKEIMEELIGSETQRWPSFTFQQVSWFQNADIQWKIKAMFPIENNVNPINWFWAPKKVQTQSNKNQSTISHSKSCKHNQLVRDTQKYSQKHRFIEEKPLFNIRKQRESNINDTWNG